VIQLLRPYKTLLLTWMTGLLLVYQVLNLHSYVVDTVDHQSIVASNDDDASWNIAKTVKTRWWKDNGWVLYGPFYFRLNHSLNYFWGRTADPDFISGNENWEKTAHHAVMTTSLLSIVGISLILACVLLPLWWMRFLFALAMNSAFLSNHTWGELLLRAHPDHLFTLFAVGALWFTVRMFEQPGERLWRLLSAVLWGISVSVKMTLSLCAPGFLLLFVPPFTRERWRRGSRYLGVMLLAYFLIGFPQTIVLDRPFRDMKVINGMSTSPTSASFLHWWEAYAQQLWGPLLVLLLAVLCFPRTRANFRLNWRLNTFVLLPFVILLGKNMMVPADHYVMPFAGMLLLILCLHLRRLPWPGFTRAPLVRAGVFFAATMIVWGSTPAELQTQLQRRLQCRTQAREFYLKVVDYYQHGEKVWVDPYLPYVSQGDKDRMEVSWEKTWSGFERGGWTIVGINKSYRDRFVVGDEPSEYVKVDIPNWRPVREFYMAFKEGSSAHGPGAVSFTRVYEDSCGQEIWVRDK